MSYAKGKNFNVVFLPLRYSAGDTYRGSGLVLTCFCGFLWLSTNRSTVIILFLWYILKCICNTSIICKIFTKDEHLLKSAILYYLLPAGREIIKRIPCVCSCVIECVSRFYKGLYITLVVSPCPFQCFL